jgi:predicted aminopeptidase
MAQFHGTPREPGSWLSEELRREAARMDELLARLAREEAERARRSGFDALVAEERARMDALMARLEAEEAER